MKKLIVEVLLSSEKRKNVLLLLQDGPKEMEMLLKSLKTTRTALLPQIRILKESQLISKNDDEYELTTVGKLIVKEMESFLRTANMFGGNDNYLGGHYIDFIPAKLLMKMPEIGSGIVIDIPVGDLYDSDKEFLVKALKSEHWLEITSSLQPTFHDFYSKMADNGTDISVIITPEIYDKIKQRHYDDFKELIDLELISVYLYPTNLEFASFIMSDECINFRLLTKEGVRDNKKIIICGPAVIEWGNELFEYYKQQSTLIIDFEL